MMSTIWEEFGDLYDESNTLLIDASPYKAILNPLRTALYANPYKFDVADDFLLTLLWPVLDKMPYCCDVRLFLRWNKPNWSRSIPEPEPEPEPTLHSVLDLSEYDLGWCTIKGHDYMFAAGEEDEKNRDCGYCF